jgi:hypothetical protein
LFDVLFDVLFDDLLMSARGGSAHVARLRHLCYS